MNTTASVCLGYGAAIFSNCSTHGVCIQGKCRCDPGYTGSTDMLDLQTCHLSLYTSTTIWGLKMLLVAVLLVVCWRKGLRKLLRNRRNLLHPIVVVAAFNTAETATILLKLLQVPSFDHVPCLCLPRHTHVYALISLHTMD